MAQATGRSRQQVRTLQKKLEGDAPPKPRKRGRPAGGAARKEKICQEAREALKKAEASGALAIPPEEPPPASTPKGRAKPPSRRRKPDRGKAFKSDYQQRGKLVHCTNLGLSEALLFTAVDKPPQSSLQILGAGPLPGHVDASAGRW